MGGTVHGHLFICFFSSFSHVSLHSLLSLFHHLPLSLHLPSSSPFSIPPPFLSPLFPSPSLLFYSFFFSPLSLSPSLPLSLSSSSFQTGQVIGKVTGSVKTQLIAHDKEVHDIAFTRAGTGRDLFASVGSDGSVRMFDLRYSCMSTCAQHSH